VSDSDYNSDVVNAVIAEAVKRPGWNQARLARALNVRPQTVNKWVKGENTPPHERWADIEGALGLTPRTFYRLVMGDDAVEKLGLPKADEEMALAAVNERIDELSFRVRLLETRIVELLDVLAPDRPNPLAPRDAQVSPRARRA